MSGQEQTWQTALVILAAGNSRRFQGNKLLHSLDGKPMYEYLAEQVGLLPAGTFSEKIVVTQYEEIRQNMESRGFTVIENKEPDLGISHSIHLAVEYLKKMWAAEENAMSRAICFAVCDQPFLKSETILRLVDGFKKSKKGIGCLCHQGDLGNPAIFSEEYLEELLALRGDVGGKRVVRRHPEDLFLLEVEDGMELQDIDIPLRNQT